MIALNLLDWRQARCKKHRSVFSVIWGSMIFLNIFLIGAFNRDINQKIKSQQLQIARYQRVLKTHDQASVKRKFFLKKRSDLLKKLRCSSQIRGQHFQTMMVLSEMARFSSKEIKLNRIQFTGTGLNIFGKARSHQAMMTWMDRFKSSQFFSEPKVIYVTLSSIETGPLFQLAVYLKSMQHRSASQRSILNES